MPRNLHDLFFRFQWSFAVDPKAIK